MSYGEMNGKANQLARHLQAMGVGPEVPVGLLLERSVDMIVAIMGILKAGGAYVPLDPGYPKQRLTFMLGDARASVLITQGQLLKEFPEYQGRAVCMDTDKDAISQQSAENTTSGVTIGNLAYVIYTSGSTGKPKGVAIGHQQILNYLNSIQQKLDLPAGSSFATVSTFAADLGNTVVFPALLTGGCLHVISQERASDPELLADYFTRNRIDCLKIVPSHLAALLVSAHQPQMMPRRRLILGGESSHWELIEKIETLAPGCRIMNHYGPTETTVGVLTYEVEEGRRRSSSDVIPLGRPTPNTQFYCLASLL